MCSPAERKGDAEAGPQPLYPMMLEPPALRWAFIRKVYSIVALQLLATAGVAATVVFVHPIARFFVSTGAGLALYIVLIVTPFITLCPLYYFHQKHPWNYLLLGIFTISLAFAIGLTCAFTQGDIGGNHTNSNSGSGSDSVHLLGCKERPRFQLPWPLFVWGSPCLYCFCFDPDILPTG
ncbi:hypothetical protein ERO13_A08G064500v2 [Gossypium hirsutum]|nr:hypothetical protein ERO13_A08G064500v2 [Gossypium hirsutum]